MFTAKLLVAVALAAPLLASAAGTATVRSDDHTMKIAFDGDLVRLDMPDSKDMHIIARDGKLYTIASMGGRSMVMESGAMIGLLGDKGLSEIKNGEDTIKKLVSLEPTGARETVAGLPGEVYQLVYIDGADQRRSATVILGRQPQVVELSRSLGRVAKNFMTMARGDTDGADALLNELERRKLGVLAFGDKLRIEALDTSTPGADRFVLPSAPVQLPQGLGAALQGLGGR